jgi:hypothetical protein
MEFHTYKVDTVIDKWRPEYCYEATRNVSYLLMARYLEIHNV